MALVNLRLGMRLVLVLIRLRIAPINTSGHGPSLLSEIRAMDSLLVLSSTMCMYLHVHACRVTAPC